MELVLILVVALLVLGPKRMPELARTLGRGLSEFRKASSDLRQSLALEDLQNELRDSLSDNKIHRPAQAGDDLAPGKDTAAKAAVGAAAAAGTTNGTGNGEATGEGAPDPSESAPTSGTSDTSKTSDMNDTSGANPTPSAGVRKPHPGELPLDNAMEHHDDPDGVGDHEGIDDDASAQSALGQNAGADSELGNVPVGGAAEPADKSRG